MQLCRNFACKSQQSSLLHTICRVFNRIVLTFSFNCFIDLPYRLDVSELMNRTSSRIVRLAAAIGLVQEFRRLIPTKVQSTVFAFIRYFIKKRKKWEQINDHYSAIILKSKFLLRSVFLIDVLKGFGFCWKTRPNKVVGVEFSPFFTLALFWSKKVVSDIFSPPLCM